MLKWSIASVCLVLGTVVGLVASPLQSGKTTTTPPLVQGEMPSYRGVVKRVLPGVVSIESKPLTVVKGVQPAPKRKSLPDDFRIPEEFRKYFDQFDQFDIPQPRPQGGFGSGFVIDPKGVILTNHHVVQGAEQVVIQLHDGRKLVSKDIKSDPTTDLAIIRVDVKTPLTALEIGNSDEMQIGDRVLAVGLRSASSARSPPESSAARAAACGPPPMATSCKPMPPSIQATAAVRSSTCMAK